MFLSGAESIMVCTIAVLVNTGWMELHLTRLVVLAQWSAIDFDKCLTAALEAISNQNKVLVKEIVDQKESITYP